MKKVIITLMMVLFAITVQAQTTEPIFSKRSSWTEITTNLFDSTFVEITTYKLDSDTLIEGKSYSKLLRNNNFYSALRETEDNKIYAYFSVLDRELLIYDFDWQPNKTLYCQTSYEDNVVQAVLGNSIDSIQLLDGKYYKCVKNYAGEVSLIRGIGDIRGFFISTFELPLNGNQYALLCFYIDDILVYSNPNFGYCGTNAINLVTDNNSTIKVYPNPSNNSITVELLENLNVDTFKIFDIKGSLIRTYDVKGKSRIEIQNLEKGIYMYSAIIKSSQKLSGKIIIK